MRGEKQNQPLLSIIINVSRQRRVRQCSTKVRHPRRVDATLALAATRTDANQEAMRPYPCKFCDGWHNGHPRLQPLMSYEPQCPVCLHNANHHDKHGGYGCYEGRCECQESLEFIYRNALLQSKNKLNNLKSKLFKSSNVIKLIFKYMPTAIKIVTKNYLQTKLKNHDL